MAIRRRKHPKITLKEEMVNIKFTSGQSDSIKIEELPGYWLRGMKGGEAVGKNQQNKKPLVAGTT